MRTGHNVRLTRNNHDRFVFYKPESADATPTGLDEATGETAPSQGSEE